jgi:hypothetical protein
VACGVNTLPQKITFPFSLIQAPSSRSPNVPPVYNEILPGWVLAHNLYALRRNEWKYRARNRVRRMKLDFTVLRPEIIELMRQACHQLETVSEIKEAYTDRDIKGLGKNFMLEVSRQSALEAYRFFTAWHALGGLLEQVRANSIENRDRLPSLLVTPSEDSGWEQQRRVLVEDFEMTDVRSCLLRYGEMAEKIARDIEHSKAKDDRRGSQIIDDYAEAHTPADEDPFIFQTWKETRRLQGEVKELLEQLCSTFRHSEILSA